MRVERWLLDDEPAPFLHKLKTWPGNVDRWNIYDVVLPGVLLMDSGSAPTGTRRARGPPLDAAQFFGCQAVTPETETTSHYFFQQCHGFALDDPSVTQNLAEAVRAGFLEDKDMILAQQRILDLDPEVPMLGMRMDTALASFRTLIEKAIGRRARRPAAAGAGGKAFALPSGRLTDNLLQKRRWAFSPISDFASAGRIEDGDIEWLPRRNRRGGDDGTMLRFRRRRRRRPANSKRSRSPPRSARKPSKPCRSP